MTRDSIAGPRVEDLLADVAARLAPLPDAEREATELLAALLDVPRSWPLMKRGTSVDADVRRRALEAADKRAAGAPLAYAVGQANFRALTLNVDERVLIPRPETELLVDVVLRRRPAGGSVVDVGTGSGAVAIALACEGTYRRVIATDISSDALDVARSNVRRHASAVRCDMEFAQGDGLAAVGSLKEFDVIVSNPPYLAANDIAALPASVRDWEPMVALLSGPDGMALTARLVKQAADRLRPGGLLALEVDARRASLVAEMAASDARFQRVEVELDLAGRERFVLANRGARS